MHHCRSYKDSGVVACNPRIYQYWYSFRVIPITETNLFWIVLCIRWEWPRWRRKCTRLSSTHRTNAARRTVELTAKSAKKLGWWQESSATHMTRRRLQSKRKETMKIWTNADYCQKRSQRCVSRNVVNWSEFQLSNWPHLNTRARGDVPKGLHPPPTKICWDKTFRHVMAKIFAFKLDIIMGFPAPKPQSRKLFGHIPTVTGWPYPCDISYIHDMC
jgi:hypothetical protein